MRNILIYLLLAAAMAACSSLPPDSASVSTTSLAPQSAPTEASPLPTNTSTPIPSPSPTPEEHVKRFLFLGGDWRAHRSGTRWGGSTDVMLLVQIKWSDGGPAKIDIVQFPRNFYTPVEGMDDMWLFRVWANEDFPGLHYYFQQVFDVDIDGMFYVNMDQFVLWIDGLFPGYGFVVPSTQNDAGFLACSQESVGECMLAFLRDNDNNWGCPEYDCGNRQMRTLIALGEALKRKFKDDPADAIYETIIVNNQLLKSDLSTLDQFKEGAELAWQLMRKDYSIDTWKLTTSGQVEYGDVPLEVRGWKVKEDGNLPTWIWTILRGDQP